MLEQLRSMAVYAQVVEQGSFRAAADALGLSPSVVTHHVTRLEKSLDTALLYRSTRKLSLTTEGTAFYAACRDMVLAATAGIDALARSDDEPAGELSVTLPAAMATCSIVGLLNAFTEQFSNVSLRLVFSEKRVNIIEEGIDLSIRIGWLRDSGLRARKIAECQRMICASPAYVESLGLIDEPKSLEAARWVWSPSLGNGVELTHPDGRSEHIVARTPSIVADLGEAMVQLAIEGGGLLAMLDFMAARGLRDGRLVQVLPGWRLPPAGVYAVWPTNAGRGSLTRHLVTHLADALASAGLRSEA